MSESVRTFIALELPQPVKAAMARVQSELRGAGLKLRWVAAGNIHLTLAFIGEVEPGQIDAISRAVEEAAGEHAPLNLAAAGIGVFPHPRRPRVLWVGTAGDSERIGALKQRIDNGLESIPDLGYRKEKRHFKAHLTLARVKAKVDSRRLIKALDAHAGFKTGDFRLDEVHVFKSQLTPGGAVYTKLHSARLKGGQASV